MDPDFIVIGAGSSGAVMANRLSAPGGGKVLLLEAGGDSRSLSYRMPLAATRLWMNPKSSWSLWSEPEPGLAGRRIPVPRGKALGGSSAINGTVYNRGSPHDYDQWCEMGIEGWDYASLLPYFKRIENHTRGADMHHGTGGEVTVTPLRSRSPLTPAFLEAVRQMGFPVSQDLIETPEGVGLSDLSVDRHGRRVSAADAFLYPIRGRQSLQVVTGARVLKLVIENGAAVSVHYLHGNQQRSVRATREVILCAGAIASPQLLLLSGIGPAQELRQAGIAPIYDLPAVGRNFNDQPGSSFEFESKLPLTLTRTLRADRFVVALAQWALGLGGPAAGPPMIGMGALRTHPNARSPDMRINLVGTTMASKVWYPGFSKSPQHRLLMAFAVAHPKSRGSITLAGPDPLRPPRILYNLFTAPEDMESAKSYYRLARELIRQPAFADVAGAITRPSPEPRTEEELADYIRATAMTTSHPMGSCRMGVDADAVVDGACRVKGIRRLRVVDASIFPTQISGNPNSTVMMIGDRIADVILGRPILRAEAALAKRSELEAKFKEMAP
jgi:choline dehydrogenase